jgi:anion-transporting  ArsA/GET3 family ATPase
MSPSSIQPKKTPIVVVCAGGGGVGKTTSSAALALALARRGSTVMVVTIDPARRLADAMGVTIGTEALPANMEEGLDNRLWALMPEPRESTRTFVEFLFHDQPEALERMLQNRVYKMLEDALAGVNEIVCMSLVARMVSEHEFDYVIVDTAPSRYALDFVAYPARLAGLLESRAMGFFGNLAGRADEASQGGAAGWARRRVEGTLGKTLGARFIADMSGLFTELLRVRERFASLARESERLLLGDSSRYVLVAAPTGAALADTRFLAKKLEKLGRTPAAILLNRADAAPRTWVRALLASADTPAGMRAALVQIDAERSSRTVAADEMSRELGSSHPHLPRVRLPLVESRNPAEIVRHLATELASNLGTLAGR